MTKDEQLDYAVLSTSVAEYQQHWLTPISQEDVKELLTHKLLVSWLAFIKTES